MKETLKTTTLTLLVSVVFGMVLYAALATAQPVGPTTLNQESSQRGDVDGGTQSVQAEAGNVSELSMSATQLTTGWQGYYGNITGSITLEDASGSIFYNWSSLGSISGEVFASRVTPTWAGIKCGNTTEISSENNFLGKQASDPDSIDNTFASSSHPTFQVGGTTINNDTCSSTNAYVNSASQTTNFYQVLLSDTDGDVVYTTLIDEDTTGFNGVAYDFQLLVGENGNATQADTTTTYNFYIELS